MDGNNRVMCTDGGRNEVEKRSITRKFNFTNSAKFKWNKINGNLKIILDAYECGYSLTDCLKYFEVLRNETKWRVIWKSY